MTGRYRLYLDESGDHTFTDIGDPAKRYLGLTGILVESEAYRTSFHPALESLKQTHFPHDPDYPVILHRKELISCRGPFWRLREGTNRRRFDEDLLHFLAEQEYFLITVVIDKLAHIARYGDAAYHPYHYCLLVMLERYCGFLNRLNGQGDVMAESRGKVEDGQLKAVYKRVTAPSFCESVARFFQTALTSKELKLKPKTANIAGLQVADLLAYPCRQGVLMEEKRIIADPDPFGGEIRRCVHAKYNRRLGDGCIRGYDQIFLG